MRSTLASVTLVLIYCSPNPLQATQQTAPPLQLAKIYHHKARLSDYWVSEKLDGVRAYWDGRQLITRKGNVIHPPAWFTAPLPSTPLDGELWIRRGEFARVSGIIRKGSPIDSEWQHMKFMVFDLPASLDVFDSRLRKLKKLIAEINHQHIQLIEQFHVESEAEIQNALQGIIAINGEGLMLHRGDSLYQARRTDDLLKLKPYNDAEARVIAHMPGKGQFEGMMGALLVELADGRQFKIGTGFRVEERKNPPVIGSIITYRYRGSTKYNLPRFASFMRVREDF